MADPAASASVTFVVQHHVRRDAFLRYEAWLRSVMQVCSAYPGYQGVDVIRPVAGDNKYSTVVRFDTLADAERWRRSADRPRLLAEIASVLEQDDDARIETGIDFWFTPPGVAARTVKPWKQWLLTTAVIWPLSLIVPLALEPLFRMVPWLGVPGVRHAIVAGLMVALVVFWIMPRCTRAVAAWLYSTDRDG